MQVRSRLYRIENLILLSIPCYVYVLIVLALSIFEHCRHGLATKPLIIILDARLRTEIIKVADTSIRARRPALFLINALFIFYF